jgi:hypothetical protein
MEHIGMFFNIGFCFARFIKTKFNAFEDIAPNRMFIVIPATESWSMKRGIDVIALDEIKPRIDELL